MALRIEDYALIGDCETAALVGRDGSIDWLCLPRFDSGACFAALLGTPEHGRWSIAPASGDVYTRRRYRQDTLILESEIEAPEGSATLVDFMPPRTRAPELVRIVVGTKGRVHFRMKLAMRFDYGSIVPWVQRIDGGVRAIAGPDSLILRTAVATHGHDLTTTADFTVAAGERAAFSLTWHPSHRPPPRAVDCERALSSTEQWWRSWAARCDTRGDHREALVRSLITLKALTYAPTGGIVAAPTTSLPERLGGVRNWDYRYCWIRDATFTLSALLSSGYREEAAAWREWLLRAVAGNVSHLQILYGLGGERRLPETVLDWLPGYEGASPVRCGNAASEQVQWDVYGELLDTMFQCRRAGLPLDEPGWHLERAALRFLESAWEKPDHGIWEMRGPPRHFTHSKAMAWVAFDRAVKSIERFGLPGPLSRFREVRDAIHADVCAKGFNRERGSFVQSYGSRALDASLLILPLVGFLPPDDPRIVGTIDAIERELVRGGLVSRYLTEDVGDRLPPGEGTFLPCSFWLVDALVLLGRDQEASRLFERLLALRNDVGLLSEEYDTDEGRMLGNFPQAFSHVGLVNTARSLLLEEASPVALRKES